MQNNGQIRYFEQKCEYRRRQHAKRVLHFVCLIVAILHLNGTDDEVCMDIQRPTDRLPNKPTRAHKKCEKIALQFNRACLVIVDTKVTRTFIGLAAATAIEGQFHYWPVKCLIPIQIIGCNLQCSEIKGQGFILQWVGNCNNQSDRCSKRQN